MSGDDMNDQPDVVKVRRDLREIEDLEHQLLTQAVHNAGAQIDDHSLPGGLAMVTLAPVANPEAWEHKFEAAERHGRPTSHIYDEDPDWEPVLQTLWFWSARWRQVHAAEWDHIPTITSEANFLRWAIDWAWENEPEWPRFKRDIAAARARLENILYAGERSERGVPCMYEECGGIRLVRKLEPRRGTDGQKVWVYSDWHCPRCHRQWPHDRYLAMVAAAHEKTKFEDIDGEVWCSVDYAARQVNRPEATIRSWIRENAVARVCIIAGRRLGFVRLADVVERHEKSQCRRRTA